MSYIALDLHALLLERNMTENKLLLHVQDNTDGTNLGHHYHLSKVLPSAGKPVNKKTARNDCAVRSVRLEGRSEGGFTNV